MSSPGTFIVSFDCEGKWGMADHLTPALRRILTTAAIEETYRRLLGALERKNTKATFAFVGAFTLSPAECAEAWPAFRDVPVDGRPWLKTFREDATRGDFDGWLAPGALLAVKQDGRHELATHGFTHLPLAENIVDEALFDHEMAQAIALAARQGWRPRTIIYPRNQVGHSVRLARHGLSGYRELLWPGLSGLPRQLYSLAAELGWQAKAQPPAPQSNGSVCIPAGHILNFWHNRTRRLIPRKRTVARWRMMLHDAAEKGGVVHLWSHPHNFLSDPDLLPVFEAILAEAASLVRSGRILNQTQEEYCCSQKSR